MGDSDIPEIDLTEYEIGRELGRGAFGRVVLATDPRGRNVAIKFILNPGVDTLTELRREVALLADISTSPNCHAGIVCYHGLYKVRQNQERSYILIMDYIEGNSLSSYINVQNASGQLLGVGDFSRLFLYLARAVAFMHSRGVAHRDIKPANIIFSEGRLVLVDLGLACSTNYDRRPVCRPGAGTPAYMPPEVLDDEELDPTDSYAHDIWSLGCTMYELANFGDFLPFGLPGRFKSQMPLSISPNRQVGSIITSCFEKDWTRRPSADRIVEAIERERNMELPGNVRNNTKVPNLREIPIEEIINILPLHKSCFPSFGGQIELNFDEFIFDLGNRRTAVYKIDSNFLINAEYHEECKICYIKIDTAEIQLVPNVYYTLKNGRSIINTVATAENILCIIPEEDGKLRTQIPEEQEEKQPPIVEEKEDFYGDYKDQNVFPNMVVEDMNQVRSIRRHELYSERKRPIVEDIRMETRSNRNRRSQMLAEDVRMGTSRSRRSPALVEDVRMGTSRSRRSPVLVEDIRMNRRERRNRFEEDEENVKWANEVFE